MPEHAWPGISGRIQNGIHIMPIRIYYEDTDAGGVVYHARYVSFCERARSDCLRLLGIHQSSFDNINFVVRRMVCDFLKPARLDDLLNLLPSRMTAWLIVLAAPLAGGKPRQAVQTMQREAGYTASPNAGYPMSAMAGALRRKAQMSRRSCSTGCFGRAVNAMRTKR